MPGGLFCAIGNPLSNGPLQKGRQLKKMVKPGETVEFKYNENGLRIQKVATSTGTTNYTLHGKNIVHMTQGSNNLHFLLWCSAPVLQALEPIHTAKINEKQNMCR